MSRARRARIVVAAAVETAGSDHAHLTRTGRQLAASPSLFSVTFEAAVRCEDPGAGDGFRGRQPTGRAVEAESGPH